MLRLALAEAVTATAVATATVIAHATATREQQNSTTGCSFEYLRECFQICFYTSLLGCFARIIFFDEQTRATSAVASVRKWRPTQSGTLGSCAIRRAASAANSDTLPPAQRTS